MRVRKSKKTLHKLQVLVDDGDVEEILSVVLIPDILRENREWVVGQDDVDDLRVVRRVVEEGQVDGALAHGPPLLQDSNSVLRDDGLQRLAIRPQQRVPDTGP